jgi:mRNA interferase RelE/StbE
MFDVILEERVIKKDIPKLPKVIKQRMQIIVEQRLTEDPILFGKPLRHDWRSHYSARAGDYRIIYRVESAKSQVFIVAIQHRKDVYQK